MIDSNMLEDYRDFLPDRIVTINDVSAVLGAISIAEDSQEKDIPIETILTTKNKKQKDAIGDSSKEMCIIKFESDGQSLEFTGVESRPVTENDIINHPFYKNSSSGCSKSLTQWSNDKSPDKFFKLNSWGVLNPLFNGWCELSEDLEDRPWWVDELSEIGDTAEVEYPDHPTVKQPTRYQRIEQAVRKELFGDEDSFDGFVSIEIDGDPPNELPDYYEVLKHNVKDNLIEVNDTRSVGESVGLVSNTDGEVTGVSNTMFKDYTSSKQLEEQPYMSREEAWRHRPLRLTTAKFMDRGAEIIEDLYVTLNFGDNQYSLQYYAIPTLYGSYSIDDDDVIDWYKKIEELREEQNSLKLLKLSIGFIDEDVDDIDLFSEHSTFTADGVFISLQDTSGNKNKEVLHDIIFEDRIAELKEEVNAVSDSVGGRFSLDDSKFDTLFTVNVLGNMLAGTLFNPRWFAQKLCGTEYSIPSSNSIEHQATQALLFNEEISFPELLQSFVERLIYIETDIDNLANKGNGYYSFVRTIGQQQLVLQTIDNLGLFSEESKFFNDDNGLRIYMTDSDHNIQGDAEIPFYLGRIVGGLSYTQQAKYDVSSPALSQYSINYVSKQNFTKVYSEVVDKVYQYTNKSGNNKRVEEYESMKELADSLKNNPSEWDITDSEFKYYYALGVTDGFTYTEQDE